MRVTLVQTNTPLDGCAATAMITFSLENFSPWDDDDGSKWEECGTYTMHVPMKVTAWEVPDGAWIVSFMQNVSKEPSWEDRIVDKPNFCKHEDRTIFAYFGSELEAKMAMIDCDHSKYKIFKATSEAILEKHHHFVVVH